MGVGECESDENGERGIERGSVAGREGVGERREGAEEKGRRNRSWRGN